MSERRSKWDAPGANGGGQDAAAAAAAAAAKIAAQFKAPAPVLSGRERSSESRERGRADGEGSDPRRSRDPHDADFVKDIEINDLRNRYMLTRAQTLTMIHEETGASVTAKGQWYPDKAQATPQGEPPLYLHISAVTQDILDKAVEKINELINSEMPQLIEDRYAKRQEYEQQRRAGPPQRREWSDEKITIGLESLRNFNIRAKVVGPQGLFVKYIQQETGTRVQIKGFGSGFIESQTGLEAQEPMYIHVAGPDADKVAEAKTLAEDLLDAVKTEHEKARQILVQQWGPQAVPGPGGFQAGYGGYQQGYPQQQGGPQGYYQQQNGYGGPQQPTQAQPPQPQGAAPPMPDDVPPPPPPDDDAPPPPEPAASQPKAKTAEEEALDKYWKDYIDWEKSFKAYHNRLPSKDEGLQDVPTEYTRGR